MEDITMCTGEACPLKDTCYRYQSQPSEYQSMFTVLPYTESTCDYLWLIQAKEQHHVATL